MIVYISRKSKYLRSKRKLYYYSLLLLFKVIRANKAKALR